MRRLPVNAVLHGDGQLAFCPEVVQNGDPILDALLPEFVLYLGCSVYGAGGFGRFRCSEHPGMACRGVYSPFDGFGWWRH